MSAYHVEVRDLEDGDQEAIVAVCGERGYRTRVAITGHNATVQELLHGLRVVGHLVDVSHHQPRAEASR